LALREREREDVELAPIESFHIAIFGSAGRSLGRIRPKSGIMNDSITGMMA